jgi:3-oxoacyl-[acyl-carrier protein] reductase
VIATDLTPPNETVEKIGPTAHALQLDVTQEEDWRSVSVKSRDVGDVDIVVNNAGYFPNRSIDELDLPTWRKTMATNLDAQFLSAKYFLPAMRKKRWGRFIGISSNMVGLAIPGMSHYIATKMGIIGFMRGLANDVASDGITANAVLPGLTNTLATALQSEEKKRSTWEQTSDQEVGRTRGCYWSHSVLNKRRCRLYHWSGNRRGRRSVSDRLTHGSTLLGAGPGDRSWTPGFRSS